QHHHLRPFPTRRSSDLGHGVSAISPTTSRTSCGPPDGGMLQIALNDHHGTSQMPRAQTVDESEVAATCNARDARSVTHPYRATRSEEHTSELQSPDHLV